MFKVDYKYVHELYDLNSERFDISSTSSNYHHLHDIFDSKYNISDFNFSFELSCSDLIEALFEKYVTPDTIVISSRRDHPSIQKCLRSFEYKELIYLDDGDKYLEEDFATNALLFRNSKYFSIRKLADRLAKKDYKNIFFISFGTCVCDGEVRDNNFFRKILHVCDMYCENTVKVLDDCQGSMWIDRDYSLFDYVLWTAHATLLSFDVGILISKPNMPIIGVYDVGEELLYDNYKQLLNKKDFATSFNKQLSLATGVHLSDAPHIFSIKLNKDYPEDYFEHLQEAENVSHAVLIKIDGNRFIRLRVEVFLNPDNKYDMLRALRYIYRERDNISEDNFSAVDLKVQTTCNSIL